MLVHLWDVSADNGTCCHTEIEAADQIFYFTQPLGQRGGERERERERGACVRVCARVCVCVCVCVCV